MRLDGPLRLLDRFIAEKTWDGRRWILEIFLCPSIDHFIQVNARIEASRLQVIFEYVGLKVPAI